MSKNLVEFRCRSGEIKLNLNAAYYRSLGKEMIYVTERGVFTLDEDGLLLSEIAPGLHPLYHIQKLLPFEVKIAPRLKHMPAICFEGLGLTPGEGGAT